MRRLCTLLPALMLGCADGAAAPDHGAPPTLAISGAVLFTETPGPLTVGLAWQIPGAPGAFRVSERTPVSADQFTASFTLDVASAPPAEAYDTDGWAIAQVIAYADANDSGELDVDGELLATSSPLSIVFISPRSPREPQLPGLVPGYNVLREGAVRLPGPGCVECSPMTSSLDAVSPRTQFRLPVTRTPHSSLTVCEASVSGRVLSRAESLQEVLTRAGMAPPIGVVPDGGTLLTCGDDLSYVYALCGASHPLCWPYDCGFLSGPAPGSPAPETWPCPAH